MSCPAKHEEPQPCDCKWCDMAVYRDQRYFKRWWPDLSVTDVAPELRYVVEPARAATPSKPCKGCLGQEYFGGETTDIDRTGATAPLSRTRVRGLHVCEQQRKDNGYNASIVRWGSKTLLAYRSGWEGSRVRVAELDDSFLPGKDVELDLRHAQARDGHEDPRLFTHAGRLCVSFVGGGKAGNSWYASQLYAVLNDDLSVERVYHPRYNGRKRMEKNWAFFDWMGELFAVYSINPHVVLHVRGDAAYIFSESKQKLPWSGGRLRGGAAPVLVDSEYWHWFHGAHDFGDLMRGGFRTYSIGVVAFEARPPFRITRITPRPLFVGEKSCSNKAIIFPAGAILRGQTWLVSAGVHDKYTDILQWRHCDVEAAMEAV